MRDEERDVEKSYHYPLSMHLGLIVMEGHLDQYNWQLAFR